jgi:hypothetical protein
MSAYRKPDRCAVRERWIAVKTDHATYRLAELLFSHLETAAVYTLQGPRAPMEFLDAVTEVARLNKKRKVRKTMAQLMTEGRRKSR